jgi:myo-inositol-1(or 4)-monophosphatase
MARRNPEFANTQRSQDLKTAHEAAIRGADVIRHYMKNREELNIEHKGRHDLVTRADVETEQTIIAHLQAYAPEDEILAEESAAGDTLGTARTWIIDPIDGTTNFTHGLPPFCISIALWEEGKPQVGLIMEVNSKELFTAVRGGGAQLNGRPIHVSGATQAENALLGTGFPYRDLELIDPYLQLFKCFMRETHGVRRPGSAAYDLACVAAGRIDGFFEYSLSPWDVAAGVLLIEEAGGEILDWTGGDEWLFGKRILCGNPRMNAYMLDRIKEYIPEKLRQPKEQG